MTKRTPQAHAAVLAQFRKMVSGGQYVPASIGKDTVSFPGMDGGAEWGGPAFDPESGLLYVNSNEMVWLYALAESPAPGAAVSGKQLYVTHRSSCHRDDRTGASTGDSTRHRRERQRGSAQPAKHPRSAAGRALHRLCALVRRAAR